MDKNLRLQYQLANGSWIDCKDRTEEFLLMCERNNGLTDNFKIVIAFRGTIQKYLFRDQVLNALAAGRELYNGTGGDWYNRCRCGNAHDRIIKERESKKNLEMVKCSCGHAIPKISVMSTSTGTSCPDCYDRMSC